MRRLSIVAAVVLGSAALSTGALAGPGTRPSATPIRTYLAKTTSRIRVYQALSERLGGLLSTAPVQGASDLVLGLKEAAGDFRDLASSWNRVVAPAPLRGPHRWMRTAFNLQAEGLRTWADAFEQYAIDGDPDALTARSADAKARLSDAAALQKAWAGAMLAEARRAHVAVPRWLELMAREAEVLSPGPPEDRWSKAVRAVGIVLALCGAAAGLAIAFGAWGVGYCGGLTPDDPAPGTLRSDLCRGTSGDLVGAGVFLSWIAAAAAPLLGAFWAGRRRALWPLAAASAAGAAPLVAVAILAAALPQD